MQGEGKIARRWLRTCGLCSSELWLGLTGSHGFVDLVALFTSRARTGSSQVIVTQAPCHLWWQVGVPVSSALQCFLLRGTSGGRVGGQALGTAPGTHFAIQVPRLQRLLIELW